MVVKINTVAVDTLIFAVRVRASSNYRKLPEKRLCVLMIKEGDKGVWQVPKTIREFGENIEEAAYRKVREVIGQENFYMEQLYSFSDSFSREDSTVNISYLVLTPELHLETNGKNEGLNYRWFEIAYKNVTLNDHVIEESQAQNADIYSLSLETLEDPKENGKATIYLSPISNLVEPLKTLFVAKSENIGLIDSRILIYGVERLRNKVEYTDIVFHLMPERFTLTELQQVQELILDEKIYTAHFRRKIEQKLTKCANQISVAKGHRPAQQYVYNPNWKVRTRIGGL